MEIPWTLRGGLGLQLVRMTFSSLVRGTIIVAYADFPLDTRGAGTRYFVVKSFNHDNVKMAQKDVRDLDT